MFGAPDTAYPLPAGNISDNTFRENFVSATTGGAVGAGASVYGSADVLISENLFEGNTAVSTDGWTQGGGLLVGEFTASSAGLKTLQKNRFVNNSVTAGLVSSTVSGGGLYVYQSSATLQNNVIRGNTGPRSGAGVALYRSSFRLENNLITNNRTDLSGGGIHVAYPPLAGTDQVMLNNTITGNTAASTGGGLNITGPGAEVVSLNNIFWGDSAGLGNEISCGFSTEAHVNFCDVQGGYAGTGNIDAPPLFAAGEFSLTETSPCIGTGADSMNIGGVWYVAPDHCIIGSPRPAPSWSMPDMGACESGLASAFAQMACSPDELDAFAPSSDSTTATLTIANYGGTPLTWSVAVTPPLPGELSWISVDPALGSTMPGSGNGGHHHHACR